MEISNDPGIIVLRLSALGDVAISIPVLLALQRQYPNLPLTLVTKPGFAPVLEKILNARVIPADTKGIHKGLPGLWRLARQAYMRGAGVADLHFVLRTRILSFLYRVHGLRVAQLDKGRAEKRRLTAAVKQHWAPLASMHERYARVFRQLGYHLELKPTDVLGREPWPETLISRPDNVKYHLGVAPFAAHEGKCYPADLMETVLEQLAQVEGLQIYLFGGGASETDQLQAWEARFDPCVCVAGKGGLTEELALISNLDLMVSMDSGNGHLAAMYGVSVLTLWGVTHPYLGFAPYGQPEENGLVSDRDQFPWIPTSVYGNKVPPGYEAVMRSIPPEAVCNRIREILGYSV